MRIMRPSQLTRRPRVTVVVPHYNYGQYLPVAVESALNQKGIDVELIIVDDRSTDGSIEVARRIAASDDRVELVEHEHNMRHIRTYNDGLSRATGDYVVLLSADDAVSPDSISRSVALMEAYPKVGLVYGRVKWFDGDLPAFRPARTWWQIWDGEQWIRRLAHRGRNAIANPEVVMRTSIYRDIGGYEPDFPHAGDMYMWLQAAARSDIGFVGGSVQGYYRNHGTNMHSNSFGGLLDDMDQVRSVYDRFYSRDGSNFAAATSLVKTSSNAVAREALLRGALLTAGGAPDDTLHAFRSFAEETSQTARRSLAWRWTSLSKSQYPAVAQSVRAAESIRWKLRTRRAALLGL
ncbi:glycosyltransferase family 2 protein [Streptomyces sp. SID6673]|nr:glycosyltransferase family 2 protein [Streptomyces sp. SID11726]NEB27410.1 glycosyltransferase family 2 protein [Streptomyces sp. SID6673]